MEESLPEWMPDIVKVVKLYVPVKKRGAHYIACCPFHKEQISSFVVDSQHYKCFSCGAVGDAVKFVMDMEKITYQQALQHLLGLSSIM